MPSLAPDLSSDKFTYPTSIYLAHACQIAYDLDPTIRAKSNLGLTQVEFISRHETQCFVGHNQTFALLAFRGTQQPLDWLQNARIVQKVADGITGQVHSGFLNALDQIWDLAKSHFVKDRPLLITGHSLGGAVATLASCRLAKTSNLKATYTFGSPRVGNAVFCEGYTSTHFRVVNRLDIVPEVPLETRELELIQNFTRVGRFLSGLSRFFADRFTDPLRTLLQLPASAPIIIPTPNDLKSMLDFVSSLDFAPGHVGQFTHIRKLVTIDANDNISVGGKELEWALSFFRGVFTGQFPWSSGVQNHDISQYIASLERAQAKALPINIDVST